MRAYACGVKKVNTQIKYIYFTLGTEIHATKVFSVIVIISVI